MIDRSTGDVGTWVLVPTGTVRSRFFMIIYYGSTVVRRTYEYYVGQHFSRATEFPKTNWKRNQHPNYNQKSPQQQYYPIASSTTSIIHVQIEAIIVKQSHYVVVLLLFWSGGNDNERIVFFYQKRYQDQQRWSKWRQVQQQ